MDELVDQSSEMRDLYKQAASDAASASVAIRQMMASGGYDPGDRLPPERELTVRLGVTRAALRKALEELEREGTIWRHVGKGTFVSSEGRDTPVVNLADLSRSVTPLHMMRARLSLEPAIAREAAINGSEDGMAEIAFAGAQAYAAETWESYETWDDALHRAIAKATGNALLVALFDQLNQVRRAVAWETVVRKSARPPRDHSSFAEHERIVEAIRARNAVEAHAAMRSHLGSVSARLFGDT